MDTPKIFIKKKISTQFNNPILRNKLSINIRDVDLSVRAANALLNLIENNCPTHLGIFVNTLLFFIITFLSMGDPFKNRLFKLKNTTYGTLIYFMISSQTLYYLTNKMLNINECRSIVSLMIHSAVYFMLLVGIMYFPE